MKSHTIQSNFLSGVLDPRAAGRVETASYNNGMLVGENIEPIHLGGVRRRRGKRYRLTMPNKLARITAGVAITAPHGGTTGNANDDIESTLLTTTDTVGTTDPFVVVHYDLGTAKAVRFADVLGIVASGGSSTHFVIQASNDDASWTQIASMESVDTTARAYRGPNTTAYRYWRVAKVGGPTMGTATITISGFNLWLDSGVVSAGRLVSFEVSTTERYTVILTDRSATIWTEGSTVGYQPTPYASADLADIDAATDAETMMIVHEDYAPRFLVRETATNFQCFLTAFEAIPQIDFADSDSPTPTSDHQVITFSASPAWLAGDTFQVCLSGDKTAIVQYAGDNSTTASNIAREVQKLWVVGGFTGVSCTRTGSLTFEIVLAGASADAYELMTVSAASSTGTASVSHTVTGVARREPAWSATRGYPRTVEFHEGRLYFGGTKSKQQSTIASRVNDILHLSIDEGLDDDPIFVTLNGRKLNAIQGMFSGRSLQVFASGGEFRFVKEQGAAITPSDAPANQTAYGAAKIRPVNIDGSTIYIQRNRKSVRDFRFDYTQNAYDSLGISSLAPHLIYDVRDLAAWQGSSLDMINLVFVVNGVNPDTSDGAYGEGTLAVLNMSKEAQIQAWVIWTTQGKYRAVSTILEDIFFLVERSINGVATLFFEQADADLYTDCARTVTNGAPTASVFNLTHLDGEECRVRADGFVFANVTPVAGEATLQQAATEVEVGLDWTPNVTPMPLQQQSQAGSNFLRKRRIVSVRAKVRNTLGLLVNGKRIADRHFDVDHFDAPATPFSGVFKLEETTNWDETNDKLVALTQVDPLPFELLALDTLMEGDF